MLNRWSADGRATGTACGQPWKAILWSTTRRFRSPWATTPGLSPNSRQS